MVSIQNFKQLVFDQNNFPHNISTSFSLNPTHLTQVQHKVTNGRPQRIVQSNQSHSSYTNSNPPRIKYAISERINNNTKTRKASHESITNSSTTQASVTFDRELKNILKRTKNDFIPDSRNLHRILSIITQCKTASFELYQHMITTNWKYIRRWMANSDKGSTIFQYSEQRKMILQIVEKLINVANQDYKKENLTITTNTTQQPQSQPVTMPPTTTQRSVSMNKNPNIYASFEGKPVLQNITNTYQNKKESMPSSRALSSKIYKSSAYSKERPSSNTGSGNHECCAQSSHSAQIFKKADLVNLVHSKCLVETLSFYVRPMRNILPDEYQAFLSEKKQIQSLIGTVIEIVLEFKDREMYDALSLWFIKADIFNPLIKTIVSLPIEQLEYKQVARIFELCACHPDGICVLQKYLKHIVDMVELFLQPNNDLIQVKYPAATVLLDLTANENCIEKVAQLIKEKDIFDVIIKELEQALQRKIPKNAPNKVYLNRFRDLMIGIVLNLTCNVESEEITEYMITRDVIRMLKEILLDTRHDWPTNGAALALLQYAHIALSNADMFIKLEASKIHETMVRFVNECKNKETKRHMYEAITLITMSRTKMDSITKIITQHCYAACA